MPLCDGRLELPRDLMCTRPAPSTGRTLARTRGTRVWLAVLGQLRLALSVLVRAPGPVWRIPGG